MVSFRDFVNAFRALGLEYNRPVIVHASLSAIGEIRGGVETALGSLLTIANQVIAPTFTYKTMIIPEVGPRDNGLDYGTGRDYNRMADFFRPDLPADPLMGSLPEAIRCHPSARRSSHPILSFAGINVEAALSAQTVEEPLAPIQVITAEEGVVLLIGVNHTTNTSIHYAERLAGRKQFIRWALTPQGVRECPNFPGCSEGFDQAAPHLERFTRTTHLGNAALRVIPLMPMVRTLTQLMQNQPTALLCNKQDERCETVRQSLLDQPSKQVQEGSNA
jgi:aminoglycoside 3-N-acetyltransferase